MNVCYENLGSMCALFYENRLGIKKSMISWLPYFVRTGTNFREPYHSNHAFPHRDVRKQWFAP